MNLYNGNEYIGQTTDFNRRWAIHRRKLARGTHFNPHLQSAWNQYGPDAFEFRIIIRCQSEELVQAEQLAVDTRRPEYNIRRECAASQLGLRHSAEAKRKMSVGHKGLTPWNKGMKMSPEFCAKMSLAHRGLKLGPHSPEVRARISASNKRTKNTPEYHEWQSAMSKRLMADPVARARIAVALRGAPHSPERRMHESEAHMGHLASAETKAKMSATHRARWAHKHMIEDQYASL